MAKDHTTTPVTLDNSDLHNTSGGLITHEEMHELFKVKAPKRRNGLISHQEMDNI